MSLNEFCFCFFHFFYSDRLFLLSCFYYFFFFFFQAEDGIRDIGVTGVQTCALPIYDSLIHHSDRGVQYASYEYTGRLKSLGIKISMTETGDPKHNAVAERVNNTIKDRKSVV